MMHGQWHTHIHRHNIRTVEGIKTVTFLFCSVLSKRNASSAVCRFITSTPLVHFRSVSVPFRMRARMRQYTTPMSVDREVQKFLWKAELSKLSVRSPLPRHRCSSAYQAICRWILLRVVDRSSVAGGCSVELTARETV